MPTELLSPGTLTVDAQVLEDLIARPEAPVSTAPLPPVNVAGGKHGGGLLLLSPREPREPRDK